MRQRLLKRLWLAGGFAAMDKSYAKDKYTLARARFIYLTNLAICAVLLPFMAVFLVSGEHVIDNNAKTAFGPLLAMVVVLLFSINRMLTFGRFDWARRVVLLTVTAATIIAVLLTGGFPHSVALSSLLLPIIFAYCLYGPKVGVGTLLVIPALVLAEWLVTTSYAFELPDYTSKASPAANAGLMLLTITLITAMTIHFYEYNSKALYKALERERQKFNALAHADFLTGLDNSRSFMAKLETRAALSKRNSEHFAIVYMDLDDFKAINDTFGHETGDAVLQVIGDRLRRTARASDEVARLGGDEFAIILANPVMKRDVAKLCQRLREAVVRPIEHEGIFHTVGISIGSTVVPPDENDLKALVDLADKAMFRDKMKRKTANPAPADVESPLVA